MTVDTLQGTVILLQAREGRANNCIGTGGAITGVKCEEIRLCPCDFVLHSNWHVPVISNNLKENYVPLRYFSVSGNELGRY
jgi:hypothetical protein